MPYPCYCNQAEDCGDYGTWYVKICSVTASSCSAADQLSGSQAAFTAIKDASTDIVFDLGTTYTCSIPFSGTANIQYWRLSVLIEDNVDGTRNITLTLAYSQLGFSYTPFTTSFSFNDRTCAETFSETFTINNGFGTSFDIRLSLSSTILCSEEPP